MEPVFAVAGPVPGTAASASRRAWRLKRQDELCARPSATGAYERRARGSGSRLQLSHAAARFGCLAQPANRRLGVGGGFFTEAQTEQSIRFHVCTSREGLRRGAIGILHGAIGARGAEPMMRELGDVRRKLFCVVSLHGCSGRAMQLLPLRRRSAGRMHLGELARAERRSCSGRPRGRSAAHRERGSRASYRHRGCRSPARLPPREAPCEIDRR